MPTTTASGPGARPASPGRGRFSVGKTFLGLLRRLLYTAVRTQVSPERAADLGLDPARPICYVLQDRHLSSLLVLEQESRRLGLPSPLDPMGQRFPRQRRSVFSVILNSNPLSPRASDPSSALAQLASGVIADAEADVQLVPVTVIWSRAPGLQDSLLAALFADAWASVGPLRQVVRILLHGRQTRVSFAEPVSLRRLVGGAADIGTAARKANRFLRFHFRRQRESAIGPDLSHRWTLINGMMASAPMRDAIDAEAARLGVDRIKAEDRARRFAWEIASDFSHPVIRAVEIVLGRLWKRLYDRVEVLHAESIVKAAPGQGIVYLPNHRSHVDYLLLSYFIYTNGLAPPHIAAGANLDFPVIGPILRRSGAFFLRRTMKGEPLYAAVFREYLHTMLARGFPIAYFIEGGRSRSGRTLAPKGGLLAMTIESHLREHPRPLLFVPVYIGYEKLLEGRTLIAELEGAPKQRESLGALAGAVKGLRREYGAAYMSFGQPLSLGRYLDAQAPGWETLDDEALRETARHLTGRLGREMSQRINDAVVVNPINLFAMAIFASPRHALDERTLVQQIEWLQTIAARVPYSSGTTLVADAPTAAVAQALRLGYAARVPHRLGDIVKVPEAEVLALNYVRNNVVHVFALPALVASLLATERESSVDAIAAFCEDMQPFLQAELMLHGSREDAGQVARRIVELFVEMGFAHHSAGGVRAPDRDSPQRTGLELLGRSLHHLLRRHYLTMTLLTRSGSGRITRARLDELMQLLTQRLTILFESAPPDFYERSTFAAYFDTLLDTGLVREDEGGLLHLGERIRESQRNFEQLLPLDAVQAIARITAEQPPAPGGNPGPR